MSLGSLSNCKKCGKVFQKRSLDVCPPCIALEEEQFRLVYRKLQASAPFGGIDIDELARVTDVPADEIERFFLDGRLSTAGPYLKIHCQGCHAIISELQRKGRYCVNCSENTAHRAGVEVKSMRQIEKEKELERQRQEALALLKHHNQHRHFGRSDRHGP